MLQITDILDTKLMHEMIDNGYISAQKHPTDDLVILNYSPATQYERMWNDVTMQCRGLIMSLSQEVVARPFAKFFNYGELDVTELPSGDPIVADKMDGSLGIIYTHNGQVAVATRGSFASDQALWANGFMHCMMPDFSQPDGVTTLVEIIYPENRIVVDYKGAEGLWLLGAIDNATGADIPLTDIDWWDGPVAPTHAFSDLESTLETVNGSDYDDDEGVVLCWPRPDAPSFRLKIKNPRYVELHRICTGLSTRTVWEALSNDTFDELLEAAPDEFHLWIRNVEADLRQQFSEIKRVSEYELDAARFNAQQGSNSYTRRELAEWLTGPTTTYTGLCFALEDGKDIAPRIWAMIKPERSMAMIIEEA